MLPRAWVEKYLFFLLRRRSAVIVVIGLATALCLHLSFTRLKVVTNFADLVPPRHPFIRVYHEYRRLLGTANVLFLSVEVKHGDVFTRPETLRKVDRITLALLHQVPGVNTDQVMSITHPRLKIVRAAASGIKIVPLASPRLPQDARELQLMREKAFATAGVRGFYVSRDGKATLIVAGLQERDLDPALLGSKIREIVRREQDQDTTIYVTGTPILNAVFLQLLPEVKWVLAASIGTMAAILWVQFRSWQGVCLPLLSGTLSAIWGLGFAAFFGLSLDPLVLVIPLLISARAHSHSVQSLERYHEEYDRLRDRHAAIVKSYTELYAPAMASLLADGLAILTLVVAGIPLIQKLAVLSSFWILSIFVSVVTLHPIVLSLVRPPRPRGRPTGNRLSLAVDRSVAAAVWFATGWRRTAAAALLVLLLATGLYGSSRLQVGDTALGEALLYSDHPYNVALREVNENFAGTSQLVVVAAGKRRGALRNAGTLEGIELFARHMKREGAEAALTPATVLEGIFRTLHEGDPKWEMLPDRDDDVGQLFFLLSPDTRRGDFARLLDPTFTNGTITLFYKDHRRETIAKAIAEAKRTIAASSRPGDAVRYRLAGGSLGVLAAVNEEVEWSHRVNLALILAVVFVLSYLTYRSVCGALIVMLPSLVAQPLSTAAMYWLGIGLNVNSLPVAAVGIGIGIDYGYYLLSRIAEESSRSEDGLEGAMGRALRSTGRTVMFTGLSLTAAVAYFVLLPMKFEAQMASLLALLLLFHLVGALLFIPPMVGLLRPRLSPFRGEPAAAERFHSTGQPLG